MMKLTDVPERLRAFVFHGMELEFKIGQQKGQARGDCPFCAKEGHFFVNIETGLWDCKVCLSTGNPIEFIRQLHASSFSGTKDGNYLALSKDRSLNTMVLKRWGLAVSILTGEWLIPAYNVDGKMTNLYRYALLNGKKLLLSTPDCAQQLFGRGKWISSRKKVAILEGPWDGMAYEEMLESYRLDSGGKLVRTTDRKQSVAALYNVVATPGCGTFQKAWYPLFEGMDCEVLFDSDHPKEVGENGSTELREPAGYAGMRKACAHLHEAKAKSIKYLFWGESGYDRSKPSGYDIRDAKKDGVKLPGIVSRLQSPPEDWLTSHSDEEGKTRLQPKTCDNYHELREAWGKTLKWTRNLDDTLIVMLACAASTPLIHQGDQIWLRVIGPPGSAKSTLCEALTVAREYVYPCSVQTGFHSGYGRGEDTSIIADIDGKTLITKDGDTLATSSNRDQTLGEARDLFDGTARARYRTGKHNDYQGHHMTWILAGTGSLRKLNKSYLGERFLDCIIYEKSESPECVLEQEILHRSARAAFSRMRLQQDTSSSQIDEHLGESMSLTGGYLCYLRKNIINLVQSVSCSDDVLDLCTQFGTFASFMRAKPDKDTEEDDQEIELATRLTSQFVRLVNCIAVVTGKTNTDLECIRLLKKVVLDTSKGMTLNIVRFLYGMNTGLPQKRIIQLCRKADTVVRKRLSFLQEIGVVAPIIDRDHQGLRWALTPKLCSLYRPLKPNRFITKKRTSK